MKNKINNTIRKSNICIKQGKNLEDDQTKSQKKKKIGRKTHKHALETIESDKREHNYTLRSTNLRSSIGTS